MRNIVLIFIISIFLFLSVAIIVIFKVQTLINSDKEISKITLVYEHLTSTRLALRIAIINQRDYIITSDTMHLNRYLNQKVMLNTELNDLLSANRTYTILRSDSLEILNHLIQDKIVQLDNMIKLKKNNSSLDEIEFALENDAVFILDLIKNISDRLQMILEKRNSDFRSAASINSKKIIFSLVFGFLLGIIMLLYSFMSLIREVKLRIKVEKELKKNSALLFTANSTKDRFFSILAHDLRNPFNAILGLNELIVHRMKGVDSSLVELAEESQRTSKNTFNLLQNLLEWARIQSGDLTPSMDSFNLKLLIEENIDLYQQAAKNKEMGFLSDQLNDINVFADRNMIGTVLRNLINNAIKFSFKGSQIEIFMKTFSGEIHVGVKDFGTGISEEHMQHLFQIDKKVQLNGTSDEKGTGLGLILCKDLIEKNRGHISVESKMGVGTTFIFSLPIS